jgi:integrase
MRPETLFAIRWEDFPAAHPLNLDGETPRVLDVPAEALKGRRNVQRIWLNDPAADAIAALRRPAGLVFGWPWPVAESTLRHELDRLRALAGIEVGGRRGPSPFYGFRRAFATEVLRIEHEAAPIAAALMMNHKPPNLRILLGHYADPIPLLQAVLPRLPQPGLPRQQLLF